MEKKEPTLIGLTGGIASGKSKVASLMGRRVGVFSVDADQIARDLFAASGPGLAGLKEITAGRFFDSSGQLNRSLFRQAIFSDKELRTAVDRYAHPLIWQLIRQKIETCSNSGVSLVVVEVPLLFEAGWQDFFSQIIVVYAAYDRCLARLVCRDLVTLAEAKLSYNAQLSLSDKVLLADHVIDNSGSMCDTILQVNQLSRLLS